jgi:hypothetical protein
MSKVFPFDDSTNYAEVSWGFSNRQKRADFSIDKETRFDLLW